MGLPGDTPLGASAIVCTIVAVAAVATIGDCMVSALALRMSIMVCLLWII